MPYIEAFVNKRDQEVFNRRVINRLGLLDAQVLNARQHFIVYNLIPITYILYHCLGASGLNGKCNNHKK